MLLAVAMGALLSGCAVGPNFKSPTAPAVEGYTKTAVSLPPPGGPDVAQGMALGQTVVGQWWRLFHSPALNDTLALALANNPTLAAARATLAQAQEVVIQAQGAYYPQLDLQANAGRQRLSSAQSFVGQRSGATVNLYSVGPLVSYGLDLFGKNRRLVEQEAALAAYQRYQLAAAYLTLTGNAVSQAVNVASARAQLQAVEHIIAVDEHNLDLVRIEAAAGKVAQTDVLSAESQLAADQTLIPPLQQQLSVARHALSILVGAPPARWSPPEFTLGMLRLPSELPVSLPSILVHERPDILAAEAQLHAASAAIGVATAQLYPSITLSASWTQQATSGAALFDASSGIWNLAAGLTAPLFHGEALEAQRRAAIDAFEAELGTYRATVLQVFGQVADVLRALQHDAELLAAAHRAMDISGRSLKLAQESYAAGYGNFLQVLDAERLYQQTLLSYVKARGQRYLDTVQLFTAMGGAWREWERAQPAAASMATAATRKAAPPPIHDAPIPHETGSDTDNPAQE